MKTQIKKYSVFFNSLLLVGTIMSIQAWMGYLIIKNTVTGSYDTLLLSLIGRVKSDIMYENGKWDISKYVSDPLTPNPHGSDGFTNPLYIITNEGFVIERNTPIGGLLDSSDYKHLKIYTTPQYVDGITDERWRVHAKLLMKDKKEMGLIFVAHYNPSEFDTESIDIDLERTISQIESGVKYSNDMLDVSNVDIRNVLYDISLEIVDNYNKVLLNNGRVPTFIDPSYVHDQNIGKTKVVNDVYSNERYLVKTEPLNDNYGNSKGIIVAGHSFESLGSILKRYLQLCLIFEVLLLLPVGYVVSKFFDINFQRRSGSPDNTASKKLPNKISFDKKQSAIYIDDRKFNLPYASNQYYLCETLFSKPTKRWEQDEILKVFGEEIAIENNRKIYDAAIAINKRLSIKLIIYSGKTYQINPELVSMLL
jgi:hypothetical protein